MKARSVFFVGLLVTSLVSAAEPAGVPASELGRLTLVLDLSAEQQRVARTALAECEAYVVPPPGMTAVERAFAVTGACERVRERLSAVLTPLQIRKLDTLIGLPAGEAPPQTVRSYL